MEQTAYNKTTPNLVFEINEIDRVAVGGAGIKEEYVGTLVDTSSTPYTRKENYRVQVKGFESDWVIVPNTVRATIINEGGGGSSVEPIIIDIAWFLDCVKSNNGIEYIEFTSKDAFINFVESHASAEHVDELRTRASAYYDAYNTAIKSAITAINQNINTPVMFDTDGQGSRVRYNTYYPNTEDPLMSAFTCIEMSSYSQGEQAFRNLNDFYLGVDYIAIGCTSEELSMHGAAE